MNVAQSTGDRNYVELDNLGDQAANLLNHPATGAFLQLHDDVLRGVGLTKVAPVFKFAGNYLGPIAGAYVIQNDLRDPTLSTNRKIYRTASNGIPLGLGIAVSVGAASNPVGWIGIGIGAIGYLGEKAYDTALPYFQDMYYQTQNAIYNFENMFHY